MTLTCWYGHYRLADGATLAHDWPVATWPEHRFACRVAFLGLLLPSPPASHFIVVIAPGPGPFRAAFHSLGLEVLLPKSVHFLEVAICRGNQKQLEKCTHSKKKRKPKKESSWLPKDVQTLLRPDGANPMHEQKSSDADPSSVGDE